MQKLRIAVLSLFPEMFRAVTESGITRRAVEQDLVELRVFNPRDFTKDRHRTVDDRPFGGGPGMVMRVEPLQDALAAAIDWFDCARENVQVIYLSPQGETLSTRGVERLGSSKNLVLIAGRYEGVDERFLISHVDQEWSIGDYVLSGGELPAMVMMDALIRRLPDALGDQASAEQDSFEDGLLDCPHYTRPEEINGISVPAVLLSGNHKEIAQWRHQQALFRTAERRPDLLEKLNLTLSQKKLLADFQANEKSVK